MACVSEPACLVYRVWSVTVTAVCEPAPLGSMLVTVIVEPATDATAPRTGARLGVPPGVTGGHFPSTAGLTRTDAAVSGWPGCDSWWAGRTVTQLPTVTSPSAPAVTSVTFVDVVKTTAALPFSCVTWAVFPDTDAIRPRTRAWPVAGGEVDGGADDIAELVGPGDELGLDVVDEPHATTDSAVTPVTPSIANRVSR